MKLKRKVISVVTAMGLMAASSTMVSAKEKEPKITANGYTYFSWLSDVYRAEDGNMVYNGKGYLITADGQKLYEKYNYSFDEKGEPHIFSYDQYNSNGDLISENRWYNNNNNSNYNNGHYEDGHINIDIKDPVIRQRVFEAHAANCDDYYCTLRNHQDFYDQFYDQDYNPNYNPDYNQNNGDFDNQYNNQYNNQENEEGILYTLVKYKSNGKAVYAYSGTDNVARYGFYNWQVTGQYNENDYHLNSVFYEEKNTFGNNFDWDPSTVELINETSGLYIWRYNVNGNIKYCISPFRNPYSNMFVFNSEFNVINDLKSNEVLPTYEAMFSRALDGYTRIYK